MAEIKYLSKIAEERKPDIFHHFADGLYAKEAFVKAGLSILKHTHPFNHLSILAQGTVKVTIDDKSLLYKLLIVLKLKQIKSIVLIL